MSANKCMDAFKCDAVAQAGDRGYGLRTKGCMT
jgi:hypothetical protein